MGNANKPLAWCRTCKSLKRVDIVDRWVGNGGTCYAKGRCCECGGGTLALTEGSVREDAAAWKFTMSSTAKRDVFKKRLGEVATAKGLSSVSYLVEDALETYLYGDGQSWLDDPYFEGVETGLPEKQRSHPNSRPVVCIETGETFESVSAAGEKIGKHRNCIYAAIKNGGITGGCHWYYAGDEVPACREKKEPKNKKPVVCIETGETFESVSAAARSIGKPYAYIHRAIKTRGTCGGYHWRVGSHE